MISPMIQVLKTLVAEREAHSGFANFYNDLFNSLVPDVDPAAKQQYTPLQVFAQEQAQYHQCRVLQLEAKMSRFCTSASNELEKDANKAVFQ
jgi:hypothetical protein